MKKLIVITTPDFFTNEGEAIVRLFDEGMDCLHLRKPHCRQAALEALLGKIPSGYYGQIVLHDCFQLVTNGNPSGFKGIHLNKRNNNVPDGFTGSVSRSCHSLRELAEGTAYNYQFLSPVFQSISKEGYGSGFPLSELRDASDKGLIGKDTIALGGMDITTIPLLEGICFGGVAVLGALWGGISPAKYLPDVVKQFKLIQQCLATH